MGTGKKSIHLHFYPSLGQFYASVYEKRKAVLWEKEGQQTDEFMGEFSALSDWGRIFAVYSMGFASFEHTLVNSEQSILVDGYLHKSRSSLLYLLLLSFNASILKILTDTVLHTETPE